MERTAAPLLCAADCPATAATLRFISEAPCLKKFLFPGGEDEFAATLHADQGLVRQCHGKPPKHLQVPGRWRPLSSGLAATANAVSFALSRWVSQGPYPSLCMCTHYSCQNVICKQNWDLSVILSKIVNFSVKLYTVSKSVGNEFHLALEPGNPTWLAGYKTLRAGRGMALIRGFRAAVPGPDHGPGNRTTP